MTYYGIIGIGGVTFMEDYKETGICCICGKEYTHWGNNALPVKDGRCCDECNDTEVLQARLDNIQNGKSAY